MKAGQKNIVKIIVVISLICFMSAAAWGVSPEIFAEQTYDTEKSANIYIPTDPWTDPDGKNTPKWESGDLTGTNWWVQAVQLPEAWYYQDLFREIKVGIIDKGFYTNHEDLDITILNPEQNKNASKNHGTEAAAIIAAKWNETGITGVMNRVQLYGYSLGDDETDLNLFNGIDDCLRQGCKVINVSYASAKKISEDNIDRYTTYLIMFRLEYGPDFIIVESAGNEADETSDHSLLGAITPARVEKILQSLSQNPDFLKLYPDVVTLTPTDVTDCFLNVGGVSKTTETDNYMMALGSNYGAEIDICAPYNKILTAVSVSNDKCTYDYVDGTSFSSPIAAGIVGLVWSVNPDMTNVQVSQIIRFTATSNVVRPNSITNFFGKIGGANDSNSFMVNAKAAVELAIRENHIVFNSETAEAEKPDPEIIITVPADTDNDSDSEYSDIEERLSGLWVKDGGLFNHWYFDGGTITDYSPVNPDGPLLDRIYNKSEAKSFNIEKLDPDEGSGYKIITESGNEYWLMDEYPDALNCHWYDENGVLQYSGTSSLHRVTDYTVDNLIVNSES